MLDPLKIRMNIKLDLLKLLLVIIKVICTMKKGVILTRQKFQDYADYKIS